jgi:dihydroflavonol-4-reductase
MVRLRGLRVDPQCASPPGADNRRMKPNVLVSGGSGYIAGFLIRQLVGEGWTVHTTVRSLAKEDAVRQLLAVDNSRLKFFAADLMADEGWAEAMAGCSHVAHVASPLPGGIPKSADELIVPARDGALRALRAAKAAGVKRFVMTSSVAAISYGRGKGVHHLTEKDWTDLSKPGLTPYVQSKTVAERAAREWVAKEGAGIEYVSICPSVVLGPVWSRDYSTSVMVVKKLLDGGMAACPDIGFGVVDVRDVADLHVRALTAPNLAGERFIASGRFMKLREIADILRARLGTEASQVTTRNAPDWLVRIAAVFNPLARAVVSELGNVRNQDASHAKAVLGWATRAEEESIVDTARALLDLGLVKA